MELNKAETTAHDTLVALLKEKYEDQVLQVDAPYGFLTISLKSEKIIEIIQFLFNHPDSKLQFLTTLCGIHFPDQKEIALMYQLHNLTTNIQVRLKIFLSEENPVAPTLTGVFPSANWMEREAYDFYGVVFTGHPNLKRILNVEEMIMFPLRKEFPLEDQTREDKNDAMFGR